MMPSGRAWRRDWPLVRTFALETVMICSDAGRKIRIPLQPRTNLASASFLLGIDHLAGMVLCFDAKHYSSGYALARPALEASLRTSWLLRSAPDAAIAKISKGKEGCIPLLGELAKDLDDVLTGEARGMLDSLTHASIRGMNALFVKEDMRGRSLANMTSLASAVLLMAALDYAALLSSPEALHNLKAHIAET